MGTHNLQPSAILPFLASSHLRSSSIAHIHITSSKLDRCSHFTTSVIPLANTRRFCSPPVRKPALSLFPITRPNPSSPTPNPSSCIQRISIAVTMGDSKTTPKVKASPAPGMKAKKPTKSLVVTLRLPAKLLKAFPASDMASDTVKSEAGSAAPPASPNAVTLPTSSPDENISESNSNTPAPSIIDDASSMPPPADGVKKPLKTGVKRSSAANDGLLKPRGKPGPKKRAKLDDGTSDATSGFSKPAPISTAAAHKLGPKANQGAINAGLRALDRSGKPCRKWQKGAFTLKTFTGVVWEIPRWRAPPKVAINGETGGSSTGDSSKENKDSSQVDSEKSNSAVDVEMASASSVPASSPAPVVIAAA